MGPLSLVVLLYGLAAPAQAVRVEKVELRLHSTGGEWKAPTVTGPRDLSLTPMQLQAPDLRLTPSVLLAPALDNAPAPRLPLSLVTPALQTQAPVPLSDPALTNTPAFQGLQDVASPGAEKVVPSLDGDIQQGRKLFDNVAVHSDPALADVVPAWPAKTGDAVRIGGKSFTLGEKLGQGAGAKVYRVVGRPELVVKLVNPAHKDASAFGYEVQDSAKLDVTGVSQARILAHSQDGLAMVKEFIPGPTAAQLLEKDGLTPAQASALGRFAAQLLRSGHSADLKPANLVWSTDRWVLIDSGGVRQDKPEDILGYFFIEDWRDKPFSGAAFLASVRAQLGADSTLWQRLEKDGPDDPLLERAFQALAEADAEKPFDEVPYPPRAGETARIAGIDYVLSDKFPAGENAFVFAVKDEPGLVIKILKRDAPRSDADELPGLSLLEKTSLPHAKLIAASASGRALVKERVAGETVSDILARGGTLSAAQKKGLADFVVALLQSGHAADLNWGNLVWRDNGGPWVLIDAGLFKKSKAWQAMGSLFYRHQPGDYLGADAAEFIAAIRKGLGAESAAWKDILAQSGKAGPVLKNGLKALAEADKPKDEVPAHPKQGDRVVIDGKTYRLGPRFKAGRINDVFSVEGQPGIVLKILDAALDVEFSSDLAGLALLGHTDIPHSRLVARSKDGRALVKKFIAGPTVEEVLAQGALSSAQKEALADIIAKALAGGYQADFNHGNLVWEAGKSRWNLIDAGHFSKLTYWKSFAGLFFNEQPGRYKGVDRLWLLSSLRSRLGAESEAWKEIEANAPAYERSVQAGLSMLAQGDILPDQPAPGERVLIAGVLYTLGPQIGKGFGLNGVVFRVEGQPGLVIKFPQKGSQENKAETLSLSLLKATGIPHTGLIAASNDGLVLVKAYAEGEMAYDILQRGPLSRGQLAALADLAAEFIRAGLSADLQSHNLVWDRSASRWVLIDAGNVRRQEAAKTFTSLFDSWQLPASSGIDREEFLRLVRQSLGETSLPLDATPQWPVEGEQVRVAGVDYTLGKQFKGGINGSVFRVAGQSGIVVKVERKGGLGEGELKGLQLLAKTKVAHAGLVAVSADGRTLVKEFVEGETAEKISKAGPYSRAQVEAFADLLAELVRAGLSGDLNRGNFIWDAPKSRWVLIDAGALGTATPKQALERAFTPGQFTSEGGLDEAALKALLKKKLDAAPETAGLLP